MLSTEKFEPASFIVYLLVAVYLFTRRKDRSGSFIEFLFPQGVYFTRSSWVDMQVVAARIAMGVAGFSIQVLSTSVIAVHVARALIGGGDIPPASELSAVQWGLCLVAVALAFDFAGYWLHRISHESPVLWPFHKLHHSAEVLTPLTVARVHPVYEILSSIIVPLCVGPVLGVIYALVGLQSVVGAMAVQASYSLFNLAGSNLRHSHLWLAYGPRLSRVLISPAMHQIHHSVEDRHWNRNYGEIFALWDWMFGSIYIPEHQETFALGAERAEDGTIIQPHPTLFAALVHPFLESFAALRKALGNRTTRVPPSVESTR